MRLPVDPRHLVPDREPVPPGPCVVGLLDADAAVLMRHDYPSVIACSMSP